ncbi:MAG: hypothetical protein JF609_08450 [Verrucomicrobia bacterium]|nr:hypothetical protein [Verrucomicrobiota bacterium]
MRVRKSKQLEKNKTAAHQQHIRAGARTNGGGAIESISCWCGVCAGRLINQGFMNGFHPFD